MEAAYCGDNRDVSKSSYYVIIAEVKLEWRCKLSYRLYVGEQEVGRAVEDEISRQKPVWRCYADERRQERTHAERHEVARIIIHRNGTKYNI